MTGRVAGWLALALALSACSHRAPAAQPTSGHPSPDVGITHVWLAVLASEGDPNALDERAKATETIVDGALVVSPGGCFSGIPRRFSDGYVLGVVASRRPELSRLLSGLDAEPAFLGSVVNSCVD